MPRVGWSLFLKCVYSWFYLLWRGVRLITVLDGGEHGSGPGLSVSINKGLCVFHGHRLSN